VWRIGLTNFPSLQATPRQSFSERFLNKTTFWAVFMVEGRRVLAGEAILSGVAMSEPGVDEVLTALVREHSRLVYRIAYAVLRRHHDAEDAAQETFMRVLRYSSKLAAVEDPKTWLARIAWRVAVDRNQHRGRQREIPLEDPADDTMHGAQITAALERLIAALPAKLRKPLVLSTIEEMSPKEVAATLGINEAAVRSRVFRARQMLREKLAGGVGRK
jgi:RNA polymerase sigma-70 factor (ECF subfamily)